MSEQNASDLASILEQIKSRTKRGEFRVTQHAQQEMVEEEISLDEMLEALATAEILEHYPEHRRGACCLLTGQTNNGRPLHAVCTTAQPLLILITAYEPKPPKWVTARQRRS